MEFYRIASHVTITEIISIKVYSDAECTSLLTTIWWGTDRHRGETVPAAFYVRNEGDAPKNVTITSDPLIAWGTVNSIPASPFTIQPNEVVPVVVQLAINEDAPFGNYDFDLVIHD